MFLLAVTWPHFSPTSYPPCPLHFYLSRNTRADYNFKVSVNSCVVLEPAYPGCWESSVHISSQLYVQRFHVSSLKSSWFHVNTMKYLHHRGRQMLQIGTFLCGGRSLSAHHWIKVNTAFSGETQKIKKISSLKGNMEMKYYQIYLHIYQISGWRWVWESGIQDILVDRWT